MSILAEAEPVVPETPEEAVEPVVPREDPETESWYPADLENAGQWIDRRVRVTLSNDNVVEGRLVSVSERELEVARLVAGGEVAYPIADPGRSSTLKSGAVAVAQ